MLTKYQLLHHFLSFLTKIIPSYTRLQFNKYDFTQMTPIIKKNWAAEIFHKYENHKVCNRENKNRKRKRGKQMHPPKQYFQHFVFIHVIFGFIYIPCTVRSFPTYIKINLHQSLLEYSPSIPNQLFLSFTLWGVFFILCWHFVYSITWDLFVKAYIIFLLYYIPIVLILQTASKENP